MEDSGLPFQLSLILNERNADYLHEEGAAVRCNHLLTLAEEVDTLLNDPEPLTRLRANARRLGRPHAACDIVRVLERPEPGVRRTIPGHTAERRRTPDLVPISYG